MAFTHLASSDLRLRKRSRKNFICDAQSSRAFRSTSGRNRLRETAHICATRAITNQWGVLCCYVTRLLKVSLYVHSTLVALEFFLFVKMKTKRCGFIGYHVKCERAILGPQWHTGRNKYDTTVFRCYVYMCVLIIILSLHKVKASIVWLVVIFRHTRKYKLLYYNFNFNKLFKPYIYFNY